MGKGKLGWAITGAGHEIQAIWDLMVGFSDVEVFLSRAAEDVLRMYKIDINTFPGKVHRDSSACAPVCGRFATGHYRGLVVAPTSSNTVAKCVLGISDNLVTNIFAQAGKGRAPIVVYPTDTAPEMDTLSPTGWVKVYPRKIDLENTDRMAAMEGVRLARNLEQLQSAVKELFL
ncbi:MAG: flavoprotein [Nitrospinota bacterium]|nr:flavoprotein [Nitrospinota bacterium]